MLCDHCRRLCVHLPRLPDQACVDILDFLYEVQQAFESAYGDQIHRYYQEHSREVMTPSTPRESHDDPPF